MAMADEEKVPGQKYVLHYNPYSVCSLMVLFTLRLKGAPKTPRDEVAVETKFVDIFHEEQLSEHFLCDVNKEGQVLAFIPPRSCVAANPSGTGANARYRALVADGRQPQNHLLAVVSVSRLDT